MRTYADHGKSGLRLDGRDALKQLIDDVRAGRADFTAVLVYDVSRWGRFQDADESAYYEFICKEAGIVVHYCAEQFENDGSLSATIIKSMKRAMAGEYSRELSVKVFTGQCRLIGLGFRQGGLAGYGLRRQLIDEQRQPKGELAIGAQKSLQTDRVVLVPGPDQEVDTVRRMYRLFAEDGHSEAGDRRRAQRGRERHRPEAALDAGHGPPSADEREVRRQQPLQPDILQAEEETRREPAGHVDSSRRRLLGGRRAGALSGGSRDHRRAVAAVHATTTCWPGSPTLLKNVGRLSGLVIDERDDMPSSSAYRSRFGSLLRAYTLVGYSPARDYDYVAVNRVLRAMHPQVVADTVDAIRAQQGGTVSVDPTTRSLDGEP